MKKIFTILICLTLVFTSVFAEDVRSIGMGGEHITDYSDIYTLDRNPAGLGLAGKHNLWSTTDIYFGGPITDMVDIAKQQMNAAPAPTDPTMPPDDPAASDAAAQAQSDMMNALTDMIAKNNGVDVNLAIKGPLSFGLIVNGFGFSLSEKLYVDASIPSVTKLQANVGLEVDTTMGYGHNFDLGLNDIALGFTVSGFARLPNIGIDDSLTGFMNSMSTFDPMNMPATSTYGYSISAGAQWTFANFLSIGAVWKDIYAPTYTFTSENVSKVFELGGQKPVVNKKDQAVAVGIGLNIPTKWTFGIISSWTVYADHENILDFMAKDKLVRNPMLGFGAGTEVTLFKSISVRAGIKDSYLSAGCGIRLGIFNIDAAIYGKELGLEPGTKPQLNTALSISFKK